MLRTWVRMHTSTTCFILTSPISSCSYNSLSSSNYHIQRRLFMGVRMSSKESTSSQAPQDSIDEMEIRTSFRIAVVGDIHDEWNLEEDAKALQFLQPEFVLFTGDFGDENVELVRNIAALKIPKIVILGNHDAWNTQQFTEKKKDNVQLQLESLGEEHIGYRRLDFPMLKFSVIGGRPFSCGGDRLFRLRLLSARYGVNDMDGSAKKIYKAAEGTPEGHSIILLAHNGPTGLGSKMNDICGRDWVYGGGDHGDPDLAQVILDLKSTTQFSIPLVVFGHMHKELAYRNGLRKMIVVGEDNTIYLNGAIVPRVKRLNGEQGTNSESFTNAETLSKSEGTVRAFTIVEFLDGKLEKIAETWVSVIRDKIALEEEHILYKRGIGIPS